MILLLEGLSWEPSRAEGFQQHEHDTVQTLNMPECYKQGTKIPTETLSTSNQIKSPHGVFFSVIFYFIYIEILKKTRSSTIT